MKTNSEDNSSNSTKTKPMKISIGFKPKTNECSDSTTDIQQSHEQKATKSDIPVNQTPSALESTKSSRPNKNQINVQK